VGDDETKENHSKSVRRIEPILQIQICILERRKRPDSVRVIGRSSEQPSPEVCSQTTLRSDRLCGNGTNVGFLWYVLVGPAGVEPATLGLEIRCSIRLSYGPITAVETIGYREQTRSPVRRIASLEGCSDIPSTAVRPQYRIAPDLREGSCSRQSAAGVCPPASAQMRVPCVSRSSRLPTINVMPATIIG
jgi:hypothetical protein